MGGRIEIGKRKRDFSLIQPVWMVNIILCLARATCSSGFSGSESAKDNWCIKSSDKVPRSACSAWGKGRRELLPVHCPVEVKFLIHNLGMKETFSVGSVCLKS